MFGAVYLRPCRNGESACLPMEIDGSKYAHGTAKQRPEEQQWMNYSRQKVSATRASGREVLVVTKWQIARA
jgi:hypothetical protein